MNSININYSNNIYYKNNPKNYLILKTLVETKPLGFFNLLSAVGRKREPNVIPKYKYLANWIESQLKFLDTTYMYSMSYKVYCILYGLTKYPTCKHCNSNMLLPKHYINISSGFHNFCCNKCAQKSEITQQTISNTLYKHFGVKVKSSMQIKSIKEKSNITCLYKYGTINAGSSKLVQSKCKKRYTYNNICFHSKPELAYYIWLTDNNIKFEYHNSTQLIYMYNNIKHFYYPDFIVNGQYVEIKGDQFFTKDGKMKAPFRSQYKSLIDYNNACKLYEAKHKCMIDNNVKILRNKDYQIYIDYINDKYGTNYLKQFKRK